MEVTRDMVSEMAKTYFEWNAYKSLPFSGRTPFPSPVSEGIACYALGLDWAGDGSRPGDAYRGDSRVEIKACSCDGHDTTSFGPKEYFSDLVFCRVNTDVDTMDIYDLGISYDAIRSIIVGKMKHETFGDQCDAGRRPRFSILETIIVPNGFKPSITFDMGSDCFIG